MRYAVVAVGKLKERFWVQACAEYVKRLGAYGKVDVREVPDIDPARAGGVEASRSKEGQEIAAQNYLRPRDSGLLRKFSMEMCSAPGSLPLARSVRLF